MCLWEASQGIPGTFSSQVLRPAAQEPLCEEDPSGPQAAAGKLPAGGSCLSPLELTARVKKHATRYPETGREMNKSRVCPVGSGQEGR